MDRLRPSVGPLGLHHDPDLTACEKVIRIVLGVEASPTISVSIAMVIRFWEILYSSYQDTSSGRRVSDFVFRSFISRQKPGNFLSISEFQFSRFITINSVCPYGVSPCDLISIKRP